MLQESLKRGACYLHNTVPEFVCWLYYSVIYSRPLLGHCSGEGTGAIIQSHIKCRLESSLLNLELKIGIKAQEKNTFVVEEHKVYRQRVQGKRYQPSPILNMLILYYKK